MPFNLSTEFSNLYRYLIRSLEQNIHLLEDSLVVLNDNPVREMKQGLLLILEHTRRESIRPIQGCFCFHVPVQLRKDPPLPSVDVTDDWYHSMVADRWFPDIAFAKAYYRIVSLLKRTDDATFGLVALRAWEAEIKVLPAGFEPLKLKLNGIISTIPLYSREMPVELLSIESIKRYIHLLSIKRIKLQSAFDGILDEAILVARVKLRDLPHDHRFKRFYYHYKWEDVRVYAYLPEMRVFAKLLTHLSNYFPDEAFKIYQNFSQHLVKAFPEHIVYLKNCVDQVSPLVSALALPSELATSVERAEMPVASLKEDDTRAGAGLSRRHVAGTLMTAQEGVCPSSYRVLSKDPAALVNSISPSSSVTQVSPTKIPVSLEPMPCLALAYSHIGPLRVETKIEGARRAF